jgi:2-C-methyl-D-erythritol 2,4-cyclodiphosphate synthase
MAAPDIGTLFSPSDARWKGADSAVFLAEALWRIKAGNYRITNIDSTLILAQPKIGPHTAAIRAQVSALLGISPDCVGIKAKTPEGMGTDNAAIAHAIVLLEKDVPARRSSKKKSRS